MVLLVVAALAVTVDLLHGQHEHIVAQRRRESSWWWLAVALAATSAGL